MNIVETLKRSGVDVDVEPHETLIGFIEFSGRVDPLCPLVAEYAKNLKKPLRLNFDVSDLSDDGLKHLCNLPTLDEIVVTRTNVTADGLRHLTGCKSLREVHFNGCTRDGELKEERADEGARYLSMIPTLNNIGYSFCNLTDAGVVHFSKLRKLRELDIGQSQVRCGFEEISEKCPLRSINLGDTLVDDVGCAQIAKMKGLEELYVGGTRITDEGVKRLCGLENLRTISVSKTAITHKGVVELTRLTNLETLFISGDRLNSKGLDALCHLTQLTWIEMGNFTLSKSELNKLRTSLPNCDIDLFDQSK